VSDISAAREIHRVGGKYLKSPWYQTLTAKGVHNLFNTNDPQFHGRHRRLLSMPMSDTSLRVVEPLVDSRIQFTIQRMKGDMERAGVVNVHKWWILMTSDIIGELSFGESLGLLEIGKVGSAYFEKGESDCGAGKSIHH
jgi:cytochrome P450